MSELNNRELREKLDQITALPRDQVSRCPELVHQLNASHPHTIEVVVDPALADLPLDKYTCFMHAFGLANSKPVIRIARALDHVYPNREFVAYLIENHLSETTPEATRDGDVIVYSDPEKITHTGDVFSGRIVSKWGTGHLWNHRVFEVPARYGDDVKFYRAVPPQVAEEAFVAYATVVAGAELIDELLAD